MTRGLALGVRYLTGYAVATDPASRDRPEWPPHPGRVFMALAAAHFETGEDPKARAALEWLEALAPPALAVSEADERTSVPCFVPVNDSAGPSKAPLQSAPRLTRDRAARLFPRVRPHDDTLFLVWPDATPTPEAREALGQLCANVIRVGHSSSLVQMWCQDTTGVAGATLVPDDDTPDVHLRQATGGTLLYLTRQYNKDAVDTFGRLSQAIAQGKGRAKQDAKAEFRRSLGVEWKRSLPPPPSRRPLLGVSQGYRWVRPASTTPRAETLFDPSLLVLRLEPGESRYRSLDLATTLRLTDVLRRAVLRVALDDLKLSPVPEVLSGHRADGSPVERPHLAYLPLAFVGREHADGHLLGVAIALPRVERWPERSRERTVVLAALSRVTRLTLGELGAWRLVPELQEAPPFSVRPETWTAYPQGKRLWASVTPVVFDSHPKRKEPAAQEDEVRGMVRRACAHIGLPEPVDVRLTTISAHEGAPPSVAYPRLVRKDGSWRRQAHVILEFAQPVVGPLLLGAGRYRGYGLFRPLQGAPGARE